MPERPPPSCSDGFGIVAERAALRERVREELSVALGRYREGDEVRSRKLSGGDEEAHAGRGGGWAASTRMTLGREG